MAFLDMTFREDFMLRHHYPEFYRGCCEVDQENVGWYEGKGDIVP
jgi:hypothetical protein